LLDLKANIDKLEQDLAEKREEFETVSNDLRITQVRLAGREKSLTDLVAKKSSTRKLMDQIKEEKLFQDIDIAKLKSIKLDLEKKLDDAIEKIAILEKKVNVNTEKAADQEQKLLKKHKELQEKEEELLRKNKEVLNKNDEIKQIKEKLDDKNREFENLKKDFKEQTKNTEVQIKKFKDFESKMNKTQSAQKIIEKIIDLLKVKGFLSDKEFEKLTEEFEY